MKKLDNVCCVCVREREISQDELSGSTAGSMHTVVLVGIGVGLLYEGSIIQLGSEMGGWLVDGAPTARSLLTVDILVVFRLRS